MCGRTGSGKTSLVNALFLFFKSTKGLILIDGENLQTFPLQVFRSKMAMIPQDPVLFVGTLRFNLNLSGKRTDDAIFEVVKQDKSDIFMDDHGLDMEVKEGGSNFRQHRMLKPKQRNRSKKQLILI